MHICPHICFIQVRAFRVRSHKKSYLNASSSSDNNDNDNDGNNKNKNKTARGGKAGKAGTALATAGQHRKNAGGGNGLPFGVVLDLDLLALARAAVHCGAFCSG